jgi:hypothetical protein
MGSGPSRTDLLSIAVLCGTFEVMGGVAESSWLRPVLGTPGATWSQGLTWVDWVSVGGVLLTAVGFVITWIQLQRTRTSREAVADKLGELSSRQTEDRLGDLLPRLRQIHDEASKAAQRNRRQSLIGSLERWNSTCERLIEVLSRPQSQRSHRFGKQSQGATDEQSIELLRGSQSKVSEALHRLEEELERPDLESATHYARASMRRCADRADALMENQQLKKVS